MMFNRNQMVFFPVLFALVGFSSILGLVTPLSAGEPKPNILFISVDDLNDWIGCLGGNSQTRTPHFDRLAKSGLLFTNAHCPAPACNPSRTAIMTGIAPNESGLYSNRQPMREVLPEVEILPKYFSRHGYWSAGSGKILHYFIDAHSWDDYFPKKETENPFPQTLYPEKRPVSLPRGGNWQYVETDWGALDATDEEFGGDYRVTQWVGEQLAKKHDQPFFLACGIYRPHEPWFVPKKYFERFPLEDILQPQGYKVGDLEDLTPEGKKRGPNRYFAHIRANGQWKQAIQGYLASIAFADEMLGRVLDSLERGPNARNTIVVLWSDHGWHLGEKQHWQKYSAWRVCTRVPLMIRVPKGVSSLTGGTTPGTVCDRPVNLVSLFATLTELSGISKIRQTNAPSLVPLLKEPQAVWPYSSTTFLADGQSVGISLNRYRYIRYGNGDEELYDIKQDPFEWNNLAKQESQENRIQQFRELIPDRFAKLVIPSIKSLPELQWIPEKKHARLPPSAPEGSPFE
ncbi:MAG: sulfatase, partial [Planctomycetota bacterium]|nr:sulfatase [Planctomycetota bacterium]